MKIFDLIFSSLYFRLYIFDLIFWKYYFLSFQIFDLSPASLENLRARVKSALDPIEESALPPLQSVLLSHYLAELIKSETFNFPFYSIFHISRKIAKIFGFSVLLPDEKLREIFDSLVEVDPQRAKLAKVEIQKVKLENFKRIKGTEAPEVIRERLFHALVDHRKYNTLVRDSKFLRQKNLEFQKTFFTPKNFLYAKQFFVRQKICCTPKNVLYAKNFFTPKSIFCAK